MSAKTEHWMPIGLLGAPASFQRAAREYAEEYAAAELSALRAERDALRAALKTAEAALSDIGDADREPWDDVAWCEARAAKALPAARAALKGE